MKVALISLARRGGMVHFQAELANSLIPILPVVAINSTAVSSAYYARGVTQWTLDTGGGGLGSLAKAADPRIWYGLMRQLQTGELDLVHVVASHEWNPLLVMLIKAIGIPLIYTMHDPTDHRGASLAHRVSNRLMKAMADAVVVLTANGRDELLANGFPDGRIYVIPHGVYTFFTRYRRKEIKQENMMLFFGRIEPYKGLDVLLAAFARARGALRGWRLVIAGSGDISAYKAQSDDPAIEVINRYISDAEVADLMQRARLVVLPYNGASQSGVIATAFAFARPVIATAVGGLQEMMVDGKTGLVIPPNDPEALANAMRTLTADAGRLSRLGRYAYSMAQREWGWAAIAQKHFEMYSKVLDSHKGN